MKKMLPLVALLAAAPPAFSEENSVEEGLDLFSRGAEMMLRGLMEEIEPSLRAIEPRLRELRPFMMELEGLLPQIDLYHLPEVLPNGDIIIRRKTPLAPGEEPPRLGPRGEVEL